MRNLGKTFPPPVRLWDHVFELGGQDLGEVVAVRGAYVTVRLFNSAKTVERLSRNLLTTSREVHGLRYYTP